MNENYYNPRKIRPVNISGDINKNGTIQPTNFSHNQINTRQTTNHNPSGNHLAQNILPQLVNLISPQIPVSQSGNQTLINMGFNATPFLQNQIYSIPNTFGALNTIASQSYGTNNVSYINNMRINHPQQSQAIMNFKENKVNHMASDINSRKLKNDGPLKNYQNPIKTSNYPVRLLINSELVGPLIGRKGEKIKEITANTGAKIDIKRESVPYSQFGLNNYMFSGCNRKVSGLTENDQIVAANNVSRGESQIVFIVSEPEKCSAAISEIMQLCTQEAKEQGREEPNMGLLAEDRFCARLIGKEGRFLNWVRCKSGSQVHVSNVPTITTLSEQPHVISLDRIISCRGGGLGSLLEAEKLISDKIRQCVAEDNAQKPCPRLAKDDSFLPPRAGDLSMFSRLYHPSEELLGQRRVPHTSIIGSGIVHKANPNWPDNLKLDENLYVRIPQVCAGSIIGSEGKSVRRIMAETGTYIQISKSNLGSIESVPAVHTYRKQPVPESCLKDELNERLITIKGTAPSQCSALTHIFSRVRVCYNQAANDDLQQQQVRLWVLLRVPKLMLGRLIGKEGKVIRQLQLSSRTFLSFPRLKQPGPTEPETEGVPSDSGKLFEAGPDETGDQKKSVANTHSNETLHNPDLALFGDPDLHPVEIFGTYDAVEAAIYMIRRLVYSSIFSQFGPALIPGPSPQLPPSFQQLPHTLLMPPPMLMPAATQRRNSDCPATPFFNNISTIHPTFVQQALRAPQNLVKNNYKKTTASFNQRSKTDHHRSQSETKVKPESDDPADVKKLDEDAAMFPNLVNNTDCATIECERSSLSPKCVLTKRHTESPNALFSSEPVPFAQATAHSRDDPSQLFNQSSPCSYYTDCCPSTPTFMNMSATTEELSFITAQDSFSNINNNSFVDSSNEPVVPSTILSPPPSPSVVSAHTQSLQNQLLSSQSIPSVQSSTLQPPQQQPVPHQQSSLPQQQQQSLSHWPSPPNPTF